MAKWVRGNIGRFWNFNEFKKFTYTRQSLMDYEIDEWKSKGYDYVKSFSGMMYDNKNTMPDWVSEFKNLFRYKNLTFTFYKMSTLEIMPTHTDHYNTYCKLFNVDRKDVIRILVMLEDWKPGHYLEIDGNGFTDWIAGDYFIWENDCPHMAANIGIEDRYTLQITATKIKEEDVWNSIHYYNILDLETKPESTEPFLQYRVLPYIEKTRKNHPTMIYLFNENIKELESIKHTEESINDLNSRGLDIYLYEPLCSYLNINYQYYPPHGTKHSLMFYSEFKGSEDPNNLRADELDSILIYIKNNNLKNVNVHTCDYDVAKHHPHYNEYMNLITNDLFVKTYPMPGFDSETNFNFTKKFLCFNWRFTFHRQFIAAYLINMSSLVSWYFRADLENIARPVFMDLFEWPATYPELYDKIQKGVDFLNKNSPLNVDLEIQEAVVINHPYFRINNPTGNTINSIKDHIGYNKEKIKDIYKDIFVDIVTESRFAQPTANYSEKTFQPILHMKPFILVAPPYTLKYLQEEGYKTFSNFWDESYDCETNHEKRLIKIFNLIDFIEQKSISELQDMYSKMTDILKHNFDLLKSRLEYI